MAWFLTYPAHISEQLKCCSSSLYFVISFWFFFLPNWMSLEWTPTTSKGQRTDKREPQCSCKNMLKKIKESGFDCICLFLLQEFHIFWPTSFSKAVHPEINTDLIKSSSIRAIETNICGSVSLHQTRQTQQIIKCTAARFRESMISLCIASLESFYQTLQS